MGKNTTVLNVDGYGTIKFEFNFERALQAAAFVLKLSNGEMCINLLLPTLYIADRSSLAEYAETITGDSIFGTEEGPILYHVADYCSKTSHPINKKQYDRWNWHIRNDWPTCVLEHDPGQSELNPVIIEILTNVVGNNRYFGDPDFLYGSLRLCPEWRKRKWDIIRNKPFVLTLDWQDALDNIPDIIRACRARTMLFARLKTLFCMRNVRI